MASLQSKIFAGDQDLARVLDGSLRLAAKGTPPSPAPVLSSGPAVTKVQQALIALGYPMPKYGADGGFGGETGSAVAAFKRDWHLSPADPVVGPGTMGALDREMVAYEKSSPTPGPVNPVKPDGSTPSGTSKTSHLSDQFFTDLKALCAEMNCSPVDLLGVMNSESGVKPWAQHPTSKATGLIQFMPDRLKEYQFAGGPDEFKKLSAVAQLPYVRRYYWGYRKYLTSAGRMYQATFLPATLAGTDEDAAICGKAGPYAWAYTANPGLDTNKDGVITARDLSDRIGSLQRGPYWDELMQRLARA